jgi:hypothetical protein
MYTLNGSPINHLFTIMNQFHQSAAKNDPRGQINSNLIDQIPHLTSQKLTHLVLVEEKNPIGVDETEGV